MKGRALCTTCGHTTVIHDRDGKCPRWAGRLDTAGLRVVIRIGNSKWSECAGHTLAFLADTIDVTEQGSRKLEGVGTNYSIGTVIVWDLDDDTQVAVPLFCAREPWSSKPTNDQRADAIDKLKRDTGETIRAIGILGA
jgi:hypothetical protein